jgi:hypothetical protein
MAKRGAYFPGWVETLGAMSDGNAKIMASCVDCGAHKIVDIERLIEIKGRSYSLVNRRSRCRLTPGCNGWVRFFYMNGVMRPLWTNERVMQLMLGNSN